MRLTRGWPRFSIGHYVDNGRLELDFFVAWSTSIQRYPASKIIAATTERVVKPVMA